MLDFEFAPGKSCFCNGAECKEEPECILILRN